MRKYLWLLAPLIIVSVIVTSLHEKYADNPQTQPGDSNGVVAATNTPNAKSNANQPKCYRQWGNLCYSIFGWPNGAGVWALFLTLVVIADQTAQTRKAAEATEASVEASRRSLEIQEAEFAQWLDIGDWSLEPDRKVQWSRSGTEIQNHPGELEVKIKFPLKNSTIRPLDIHSVRVSLEVGYEKVNSTFVVEENMQVPPKEEYSVVLDTVLTELQATNYIAHKLLILASVHVRFSNALGKGDTASFNRLICSRWAEDTKTISKGHKAVKV